MFKSVILPKNNGVLIRAFSTGSVLNAQHECKVLVVGGGSGGAAMAGKFAGHLKPNEVIVVDPADKHYYQPMFTMIGGGMKRLRDSYMPMKSVLPRNAKWLQDSVAQFEPHSNRVKTAKGNGIKYEYMIVATGLELRYDLIPGALEALETPDSGVCSNYSPQYVDRTLRAMQQFKTGNAVFTFPATPVKCPGAPQKILYIVEHYFRKHGKREKANLIYNTSLPVIFGVKHYADALWKVVKKREIKVNLQTNLVEIKPDEKIAVFEDLSSDDKKKTCIEYEMLHVTPPMKTPAALRECKDLVNEAGFVEVNKDTMQHVRFDNIFAIGDCCSTPNSKTAASVAAQSGVLEANLKSYMKTGKANVATYDGYASCPLVTGYDSCIMAEFDYNLQPLETFPIRQDRERYSMFLMKKYFMPALYWNMFVKGYWDGPAMIRRILHLGGK